MACPTGWYRVSCPWLQAKIAAIQASDASLGFEAALAEALIQAAVNFGPFGAGTGGEGTPGPPGYGFPGVPTPFP